MKLGAFALLLASLALAVSSVASREKAARPSPAEWVTPAEQSGYRTTPRYAETMEYVRRVAAAAPRRVRLETFGKTGEGRDLVAVVVSGDGVFDPEAVRRATRPVVLILNAIHAGEMDGKDACLALLRDIAVTRSKASLVEKTVLVIVPIYSADGHERFGPYNRINQNGPEEMGWRTQAKNLNLNRDFMKADAPETRAFLALWNRWQPDFFVDDHVTDGADYQYDVTYGLGTGPDVDPALDRWQRETLGPYLEASVTKAGHVIGPFIGLKDDNDPSKGLALWPSIPRFSTGYAAIRNRANLLVEMHMLKDYRTRVTGNYEILRALLEVVHRDAKSLVAMNRAADGAPVTARFPLVLEAHARTEPFRYLGFRFERSESDLSGAPQIRYLPEKVEMVIPREFAFRVTEAVAPPAAYIVPAPWDAVIGVLAAHGVAMRRTSSDWTGRVGAYRCENPRWQPQPYEGRHVLFHPGEGLPKVGETVGDCRLVEETVTFPAGSAVVSLDQPAAKVAIHWLEPRGPDSALAWGFFNAIFERKEYAEPYVMEKVAREMLAKDPVLKAEFERRLGSDAAFAGSPAARLDFFYQRSPWRDARRGLYPVGRLRSVEGIPLAGSGR